MRTRWLCIALLLGVPLSAAPSSERYWLSLVETSGGGGPLAGGGFWMFSSITAVGPAGPIAGGEFELTTGIERRRDQLSDPIFRDGFEGG
jgi:hypothetical protein